MKILFIKSITKELLPTEIFAEKILKSNQYINNPLVNREEIETAFNLYGKKLNPLNKETYSDTFNIFLNIEGHFISTNIPEIESIVIDRPCDLSLLNELLSINQDITHIGLTVYGNGLNESINLIDYIKTKLPKIKLYVGGVGVVYPQILSRLKTEDICLGEGVNFLRKKFNLKLLSPEEFRIPKIIGRTNALPLPINTYYLVTQIGCFNNCDFCITSRFHKYLPIASAQQIIGYIEDLCKNSQEDIFLYFCEPNAFNPLSVWKKIFNYFIENPNNLKNNVFLIAPSSLNTLKYLPLEEIQYKSPVKFLMINYGIEKTLGNDYEKNSGKPKEIIKKLNNLGIITNHNYILGLPDHDDGMINEEIQNNLTYSSDLVLISTFKPIPTTPLYEQLLIDGKIYGDELPNEFLYIDGFLPFNHKYLGPGFSILKYTFKAYYETEKFLHDVYGSLSCKFIKLYKMSKSSIILELAKKFHSFSTQGYESFKQRMPKAATDKYRISMENTAKQLSHFQDK